ncbi:unnamed protein product [Orchesella dallaii]|uniref:Glucose-methanol-choline oxidoreductase N-terminal domain-containing protein n=1 Tax=Orchesella dallaii TaxID=48710 RepID=A0ABP1QAQ0_9HEXA
MIIRAPNSFYLVVLNVIPFIIGYFGGLLRWRDVVFGGGFRAATNDSYDFVVVGGGSAGCLMAARLSENPRHRVLLLEAGGDPNPIGYIPLAVPFLQNHPATDWQYKTVPSNNSGFAFTNKQLLAWPRAKVLGGGSSTNFMIYMRGNPKDYNEWATIAGDSRWAYDNVESYFKNMEDYHGNWPTNDSNNEFHGTGGPLRVEGAHYTPGLNSVLDAVRETGFSVRDLNVDQKEGFSPVDLTQKRGHRWSAYSAYLQPVLRRKNLKILRYSYVTKIHLNSEKRATGVSFIRHGLKSRLHYVNAKEEVILCAGAISSPKLLMVSGIGPSEHLKSVGIEPLVDLPVGRNLQDHVITFVGPMLLNQSESFLLTRDLSLKSFSDFAFNGIGPLTSPMGITSVGVTSTSSSPEWPNLLHTLVSIGVYNGLGSMTDKVFGCGKFLTNLLAPYAGHDAHVILLALGKPRSRGFIELKDNNPYSKPIINPQYYSDPLDQDMQDMIEGFEMLVNLYENTTALGTKLGARLAQANIPPCGEQEFKSKAYYECVIRTMTFTLFHPVGTNPMGKIGDPNAVVDSELRVIGTTGLRVVDASVMPVITNANTNAPTMMIAEVAADLIENNYDDST